MEAADNHTKHTAIDNELAEQVLSLAKVGIDYWQENWFINNVLGGKLAQSGPGLTQTCARGNDVFQVIQDFQVSAGVKKKDPSLVGGPKPAQALCSVTARNKPTLCFHFQSFIRVTVKRSKHRMGRGEGTKTRQEIFK